MSFEIHAFASETQYAANVLPVYDAVPFLRKGDFRNDKPLTGALGPVVVSSYGDMRKCAGMRIVFMEHGTGQTYSADLASYAGSSRRDGVELFLCPNERVADLNYEMHPDVPVEVIGSPKMDPWWDVRRPSGDIVGLAWHWDAAFVPEARTALWHYMGALEEIGKRFHTLGTAHPRIAEDAQRLYREAGIEYTADSTELYRRASVLVCDNTSLGWEFIAMDRPVIWCNAPCYRRFINHGMRFWDLVDTGIEIDEPVELAWAIDKALSHDDKHERRADVADSLYAYRDGSSARRGVDAITQHLGAKRGGVRA